MTGLLYHVLSEFLRRVDIWCEIKLIEVFCQLADICCARRFRHLADAARLALYVPEDEDDEDIY